MKRLVTLVSALVALAALSDPATAQQKDAQKSTSAFVETTGRVAAGGAVRTPRSIAYPGPKNTQELTAILSNSTNPVLRRLDTAMKNLLIANIEFYDGHLSGMKIEDATTERLFHSKARELIGAILGVPVIASTGPTNPVVTDISLDDFTKAFPSSGAMLPSVCEGCAKHHGDPNGCCYPPSRHWCVDYVMRVSDGRLFRPHISHIGQ